MLQAYVAAGFDPAAFWFLTPRLYLVQMRGVRDRLKREQEDRAWSAWHIAALSRVETLPEYSVFVGDRPKVQPPEVQQQMLVALAQAWGAEEVSS